MNTKTLISLKIDKSLKKAAQETAEEIGIPLSTLINAFLKQFVRTKEATLNCEWTPSKRLRESIAEGEKEHKEGKLKTMTFDELVKDLES